MPLSTSSLICWPDISLKLAKSISLYNLSHGRCGKLQPFLGRFIFARVFPNLGWVNENECRSGSSLVR